jgi:uncharacterized membrane protein
MAKQNYFKLALVIVLTMAAASTVHAQNSSQVGSSIGGSSFSNSQKVSCYYAGNAGDATGTKYTSTSYQIACGHLSGDKVIAAKSGDARLFFSTSATPPTGASGITDTTLNTLTGWTSM